MVSMELLVGLLLSYTLLYLLMSYFLRSHFGNGNDSGTSSVPNPRASGQVPTERGAGDASSPSAVVCEVCRAENEPGYTYCRNCVSELGGPSDRPSRSP